MGAAISSAAWAGRLLLRRVLAVVVVVVGVPVLVGPDGRFAAELYVSPAGRDDNDGWSPAAALRSVQVALDRARPGMTIDLAPGVYRETVVTTHPGAPGAPITVRGGEHGRSLAGRHRTVLAGSGIVFAVNHSWYVLRGFTIDGQEQLSGGRFPTALAGASGFKDSVQDRVVNSKLVYLGAAATSRDVTGVVVNDMLLTGSGGECVRLRNNAHDNVVENSLIRWCGMRAVSAGGTYRYHNGEGVYIGTSPKSSDAPMANGDYSWGNVIRGNVIDTFGAECLDVKENAHDNVFVGNVCGDNDEPASFGGSNVELRGDHNLVQGNVIADSRGWNVVLASDSPMFDRDGNTVRNNTLSGAAVGALRIAQGRPGLVCGNTGDGVAWMPCPGPAGHPR